MKTYNNIYYKICDTKTIIDMAHKVCLNTKNKHKVNMFETYYMEEIYNIKNILLNKNYIPGEYNIFLIWEPKVRLIMSSSIRDKIINHLVSYKFLVDCFDPTFIDSCIATRKGKGTHYGMRLLKKYINEAKTEGKDLYYLKFDIKKYFYNIDHDIVKSIISNKIKDDDALKIIYSIIDSTDREYVNECIENVKSNAIRKIMNSSLNDRDKIKRCNEIDAIPTYKNGKGFSIGNMSSQIIGILYLNELDHFIKENLHIKYYVRYMDDGVIIHNDKEYLKYCMKEIETMLKKYKLLLNYKKSFIKNVKYGVDFLGFVFYLKDNKVVMRVRGKTKRKFIRKVKNVNSISKYGFLKEKESQMIIANYKGHLKWGSCGSLVDHYVK